MKRFKKEMGNDIKAYKHNIKTAMIYMDRTTIAECSNANA